MHETALLHEFKDGLNRLRIFSDRVELRLLVTWSYKLDEIESAAPKFFGMEVGLRLRNGEAGKSVQLKRKDTAEAVRIINEMLARAAAGGPRILCTVIGGSGLDLEPKMELTAQFGANAVRLEVAGRVKELPYTSLRSIDITGPGRVTTDAGVVGGGFGVEGALLGIGAANLLNALSQKTSTNTMLTMAWPGSELFLHTCSYTPDQARIALSHAFAAIHARRDNERAAQAQAAPTDVASQLERLRELRNSGDLSPEDYELAKAKVLGSS